MKIATFDGGVIISFQSRRLQLSNRQIDAMEIIERAWHNTCASPREDLYAGLWGLSHWSERRRVGQRATKSQRASLARTLRRLEQHGLIKRSGIRDPFAEIRLTDYGRQLLAAMAEVRQHHSRE